jgi:uncharacterized protein YjbJ (UPF0337 family)
MSGELDQLDGKAKELEGKVTGDAEKEAEGDIQQGVGKAENAAKKPGDAVDAVAKQLDR